MTSLFKKLNFKGHKTILVLNAPLSFNSELMEIASFTHIEKDTKNVLSTDFAIIFVLTQEQIDSFIDIVYPILEGDAILWFCYPKGTSKKYKCDFNRDTGWSGLGKFNLEPVRVVAIDEDWSALRFRKVEYIKTMIRSFALSQDGKNKTSQSKSK